MATPTEVTAGQSSQVQTSSAETAHPLDPLSSSEIDSAVAILRAQRKLGEKVRFESVILIEPAKESVLSPNGGAAVGREAFIILLDNDTGATHEAVVS